MNPFRNTESKVKVETRPQTVSGEIVLLVGLIVVLLLGGMSGF